MHVPHSRHTATALTKIDACGRFLQSPAIFFASIALHNEVMRHQRPSLCNTWRRRAWSLVIGTLSLLPAPLFADPPTAARSSLDRVGLNMQLTVQARHALQKDRTLAREDLFVSVHDRTAILRGKVPSREIAQQAEACVRQVLGIEAVENRLEIEEPEVKTTPRPLPEPQRLPDPAARKMPDKPGFLGILGPAPYDLGRTIPLAPQDTPPAPPQPLAPPPPPPSATDARPPAATLGAPVAMTSTNDRLADAIASLCRDRTRFRQLRIEIQGNTVFLRGTPGQSADLFALAEGVSLVPGVERVVVENIYRDGNLPR